jgi:hypothetical protein
MPLLADGGGGIWGGASFNKSRMTRFSLLIFVSGTKNCPQKAVTTVDYMTSLSLL